MQLFELKQQKNHKNKTTNSMTITYITCICIYIFTRYLLQEFTSYIFSGIFPGWYWVYLVNILFYTITIVCGCVAGMLVHKKTIRHASLITSLGISIYTFLTTPKITDYSLFFYGFILGIILGAIGGCVSLAVRWLQMKYC
ncbi:hypothetical protein [Trabulsiella guamensis]|uniref:hypothetical protein n=1 Tax=Trabulsiella guamensis TaxID=158852 RepID=UPI0012EC9CEE|nr:hypothetical protein [Trabulsiella guamensis]